MASLLSLQLPQPLHLKSFGSVERVRITVNVNHSPNFNSKEQGEYVIAKNNFSIGFLYTNYASSRWFSSRALSSSMASSAYSDHIDSGNGRLVAATRTQDTEFNRVNCLVWILHEAARSFSLMIQSLELAQSGPELSMAWVGVDVHAWHKQLAYQVAVYALLKSATDAAFLLSREHCDNASLVSGILSPKINLIQEYIESQLKTRCPELVQWFRTVELQRIAGYFVPLLKKWLIEYAGSGVAEIIVAISCCAAVGKLGSGRLSVPSFTFSIDDVSAELMDLTYSLVSVDKLHDLATEAGFEEEFLYHFGAKVFPSKNNQEVEFWIGLALKKLYVAFQRESSILGKQSFHEKVPETSLATLGLFAYLGRRTRVFLSEIGMKDVDEQVKDFLSQGLLTVCLEDYWAAYDQSCCLMKLAERGAGSTYSSVTLEVQQKSTDLMKKLPDSRPELGSKLGKATGSTKDTKRLVDESCVFKSKPAIESLFRKASTKLMSRSSDIIMGTQLLFIDIMVAMDVLLKQLRGHNITRRERKKIERTLADITSLIPITILMLLPLSVVGHAAILAAIKRYMPSLIPSPYSSERLDIVKQLKRTKKMEVETWSNVEDTSSTAP